jgi:hypothetical protein
MGGKESVPEIKNSTKNYVESSNGQFRVELHVDNKKVHLVSDNNPKYFALKPGTEYSINLINNGPTKADASIKIDGIHIGLFRVEANGYPHMIYTPQGVNKALKFNSAIGHESVVTNSYNDNYNGGSIEIEFKPEDIKFDSGASKVITGTHTVDVSQLNGDSSYTPDLDATQYGSGGTILGNTKTGCQYLVANITHFDQERIQTVRFRLVSTK